MRNRLLLVLLSVLALTGCRKEEEVPEYSKLLIREHTRALEEYNNMVSSAREYEINVILDYINNGSDYLYSNYTILEEASDTDGSVEYLSVLPKPLGKYDINTLASIVGLSVQEAVTKFSNTKGYIEETNLTNKEIEEYTKAFILTCTIDIHYTYNKKENLLDQVIIIKDRLNKDNIVVLTWSEEGCVNLEAKEIDTFW